ncbi:MAG: hypothetical protein HQ557_16675 [Bacteroidetes bacterium]|nr:hypothetical protein [Bacteroidota bacterium]
MKDQEVKSFIEHKKYLHEIVKLKLWFVWNWKQIHRDESVAVIFRDRVDIYRKTDINQGTINPEITHFDDPRWVELEQKIVGLYEKHQSDTDASIFEREAFQIVKPSIDARAERDYEEPPYVLNFKCGSLDFDLPKAEKPNYVFMHIANAISPRSFFAEKKYLLDCFISLLDRSSLEYGADSIETETWLNSYPKWLEYFPEEWISNMGERDEDVMWHYGFWGQFITRRGLFDERLGRQLRETGRFPFLPRHSWCSIKAMREHILKKY